MGTQYGANPPEVDVQMAEMVSNLMEHNKVAVTGHQTELPIWFELRRWHHLATCLII